MQKILFLFLALCLFVAKAASAGDLPLGPGDIVRITIYGDTNQPTDTRITDGGDVTVPMIGPVPVGGLSTPEAERKVAQLLRDKGYMKDPQVNILVTTVNSQLVSVIGQVNKPGRIVLDNGRTVTDMVASAGGVTPDGGDMVTLIRNENGSSVKYQIDLYELSHGGDPQKNLRVKKDDVIIVERASRFFIYGEVQHPGAFRLDRGTNVLQAVALGGGLTDKGTMRGLEIKRKDADGKLQKIKDINEETVLLPDDIVYVKESWF